MSNYGGGSLCGVVVNELDCNIIESSNYDHNITFTFGLILLEKCYGEICNHDRNILNKGLCHWSSDIEENRETPLTEHDKYYTFSLCKYIQ